MVEQQESEHGEDVYIGGTWYIHALYGLKHIKRYGTIQFQFHDGHQNVQPTTSIGIDFTTIVPLAIEGDHRFDVMQDTIWILQYDLCTKSIHSLLAIFMQFTLEW